MNGRSVISFPQDSKKEAIRDFMRKVRKRNPGKGIIVLDNFKSHKAGEVLVFLPPVLYNLDPKNI